MASYKLIPYGISDFAQVREESLYYVDKTMYLPKMEAAGHFLFLIRPRRFGKSLFLSMMRHYYDVNEKEKFSDLFSRLWIEQNPTPLMGIFQVLYLDFSQVGGDMNNLFDRFNSRTGAVIDS